MKKTTIFILFFCIAIMISSCKFIDEKDKSEIFSIEESSVYEFIYIDSPPKNPIVINRSDLNRDGETIKLEDKIGTEMTIELPQGRTLTGIYSFTRNPGILKMSDTWYREIEYPYDHFTIEENTGELIGFSISKSFGDFKSDLPRINEEQATKISLDYLYEVSGRSDWSDNEIRINGMGEVFFTFQYKLYKNDIIISISDIHVDCLGNIVQFGWIPLTVVQDIPIPTWEDEEYIQQAKEPLCTYFNELYESQNETVKDIEVTRITHKWLRYLKTYDSNAVEFGVIVTAVFESGREESANTILYYLF